MVTMSQKEFQRVKVIENAAGGRLSVREASRLLQVSERQVQRLKRRYRPDSIAWVQHGNRGRSAGETVAQESAVGGGGESSGAVSGEVFRSERAALSREVAGRAPGRDQLQLGEGVAARGGDGCQGALARRASQVAATLSPSCS